MKLHILPTLLRRVRLGLRLVPMLLLLVVSRVAADPGDTSHTYSNLVADRWPPYSTVSFFADAISGSATLQGYQSSAYKFTAEVSGPME